MKSFVWRLRAEKRRFSLGGRAAYPDEGKRRMHLGLRDLEDERDLDKRRMHLGLRELNDGMYDSDVGKRRMHLGLRESEDIYESELEKRRMHLGLRDEPGKLYRCK
ncbi:uncharacterized protein [Ptychodera flava]|uniref:uncharacterized protein n=1 Tax=Ptychodera flava TaxID=63121 RepID=UPI00396A89E4